MNAQSILEKHKNLKLPAFPNDDDFSNWVEELIELDAYYYGLVTSGLNTFGINLLEDLKQRMLRFEVLEDDKSIYRECEAYIVSLKSIVQIVRDTNHHSIISKISNFPPLMFVPGTVPELHQQLVRRLVKRLFSYLLIKLKNLPALNSKLLELHICCWDKHLQRPKNTLKYEVLASKSISLHVNIIFEYLYRYEL